MAVKKLRVAELDFDGIKNNLISFLKEDPNFGSDGSYNYEVKDGNGCTEQLIFSISQPEDITITENNITHISCFGETTGTIDISVSNTQGNYQIFWTLLGSSSFADDSLYISELIYCCDVYQI